MQHLRSCPALSVSWSFAAALLLACPGLAQAHEAARQSVAIVNGDHLGESLHRFRVLHRGASCISRPEAWSDERSFKTNWLLWMDCSLERGVTFEGRSLLGEVFPTRPFGLFASFYKKKLVELSYTLAATSIDDLLPTLNKRYGQASRVTYNRTGNVDSASWAGRTAFLDVELVPISPAVDDRNFLKIGKGPPSNAVRIRLQFNAMPPSDP